MVTAIVQSHGMEGTGLIGLKNLKDYEKIEEVPISSVILVDKIDKTPRDFPN